MLIEMVDQLMKLQAMFEYVENEGSSLLFGYTTHVEVIEVQKRYTGLPCDSLVSV